MADQPKPPPNPLDPSGLPMMCADCAFYRGNAISGFCQGVPPSPVMVGVIQSINGNQPNLLWFYPPKEASSCCAVFLRDPDKELEPLAIAQSAAPAAAH